MCVCSLLLTSLLPHLAISCLPTTSNHREDLPDEDRNMTLGDYYFRQIDSDQDIAGDKDLHDSLSGMSLGLAALSSEDLAILPDGMRSVIKALERKIEEGGKMQNAKSLQSAY